MQNERKPASIPTVKPKAAPAVSPMPPKVQELQNTGKNSLGTMVLIIIVVLVMLGGIGVGYMLSSSSTAAPGQSSGTAQKVKGEKSVGMLEKDVKYDEVNGKLVAGGIENEGTHHLERPGGESQNVYLTSSVVHLDDFVGQNVKVWGVTFTAQKAGWLMDVAKLEVQ